MAIRIRTTRSKLINSLISAQDPAGIGYLVKDVEYVPASKIDAKISSIARDLSKKYDSRHAADVLFLKRDAFDHEAEVRAIIHDKKATTKSKPKEYLKIPIEPNTLLESIFFDPRADDAFVKMCMFYLRDQFGFKHPMQKSALYRTKDPLVVE